MKYALIFCFVKIVRKNDTGSIPLLCILFQNKPILSKYYLTINQARTNYVNGSKCRFHSVESYSLARFAMYLLFVLLDGLPLAIRM